MKRRIYLINAVSGLPHPVILTENKDTAERNKESIPTKEEKIELTLNEF
jgi:hypothetical protein